MPPKKRTAAAAALVTAPAKRPRTTTEPKASPSGRPQRATTLEAPPQYNFTRPRTPVGTSSSPKTTSKNAKSPSSKSSAKQAPSGHGRGRPPKSTTTSESTAKQVPSGRGRGRPPKSTTTPDPVPKSKPNTSGRPPRSAAAPTDAPAQKPRGRPPGAKAATEVKKPAVKATAGRRPGRPAGATNKKAVKFARGKRMGDLNKSNHDAADAEEDVEKVENIDETQYWLMKAEPESRMEKGVDVKFSIDDLQAAEAPEAWDGVRNPVARNNMRAMKKGDLAFFYHSNCKKPGIVGIMEIVQEHTVDESAFDPKHPYYDEKSSRDKPKWEVVHVKFVRKFNDFIALPTLRSFAEPGGVLHKMQTLIQSRLSVSSVQPKEWEFIMSLVDENDEDENDEQEDASEEEPEMEPEQVMNPAITNGEDTEPAVDASYESIFGNGLPDNLPLVTNGVEQE